MDGKEPEGAGGSRSLRDGGLGEDLGRGQVGSWCGRCWQPKHLIDKSMRARTCAAVVRFWETSEMYSPATNGLQGASQAGSLVYASGTTTIQDGCSTAANGACINATTAVHVAVRNSRYGGKHSIGAADGAQGRGMGGR